MDTHFNITTGQNNYTIPTSNMEQNLDGSFTLTMGNGIHMDMNTGKLSQEIMPGFRMKLN